MSLRLLKTLAETENRDELHMSRLLILLQSADARKKTPETKVKAVEGITKLAKLDYLLRYPTSLERVLLRLKKDAEKVQVLPRERTSIETKMIRFRYGPWDSRYRRWLGLLHARGLVTLGVTGNTIEIGLTDKGREVAALLRQNPLNVDVARRSDLTVAAVGSMNATRLKDFVYETIPEIIDMKWGEPLSP
jgi:hypothetical protein